MTWLARGSREKRSVSVSWMTHTCVHHFLVAVFFMPPMGLLSSRFYYRCRLCFFQTLFTTKTNQNDAIRIATIMSDLKVFAIPVQANMFYIQSDCLRCYTKLDLKQAFLTT